MHFYYAATATRSQALLLERRMQLEGIQCEIAYMPRSIMTDLCNLGVKFPEHEFQRALYSIYKAALPNSRIYKEVIYPFGCEYIPVDISSEI